MCIGLQYRFRRRRIAVGRKLSGASGSMPGPDEAARLRSGLITGAFITAGAWSASYAILARLF
jgi:hypothetical protein